jgi:hypothetical protein
MVEKVEGLIFSCVICKKVDMWPHYNGLKKWKPFGELNMNLTIIGSPNHKNKMLSYSSE